MQINVKWYGFAAILAHKWKKIRIVISLCHFADVSEMVSKRTDELAREDFARMADRLQRLQGRFLLSVNDVSQLRDLFA